MIVGTKPMKVAAPLALMALAFAVLAVTLHSSSELTIYANNKNNTAVLPGQSAHIAQVDYELPDVQVLPGGPEWIVKALADKVSVVSAATPDDYVNRTIELSNERLVAAHMLFLDGKYDEALMTLLKAEEYLSQANAAHEGIGDVTLSNLVNASLKHREILEWHMALAPEEIRPYIGKTMEMSKAIYEQINSLNSPQNTPLPENPF